MSDDPQLQESETTPAETDDDEPDGVSPEELAAEGHEDE